MDSDGCESDSACVDVGLLLVDTRQDCEGIDQAPLASILYLDGASVLGTHDAGCHRWKTEEVLLYGEMKVDQVVGVLVCGHRLRRRRCG